MRNSKHRKGMTSIVGVLVATVVGLSVILVGSSSTLAKAPGKATSEYVVRSGDTLSGIALRFKTTVSALKALNTLKRDMIRVGQTLTIPAYGVSARDALAAKKAEAARPKKSARGQLIDHTILPGDSLGRIANKYGTSVAQLRLDNPNLKGDRIVIGRTLKVRAIIPSRKRRRFVYTIQPGDTLSGIGANFGVSWPQIARWNPRKDPKRLRVGSRINVFLEGPKVRSTTKGRPQRGKLVNGEQLPPGPGYRRQSPRRAWGTNETITQILRVIAELRMRHPKIHDVLIGDISKKGGGKLLHHISHQSGRDVDIGFVFNHLPPEGPTRFLRLKRNLKNIDYKASWTLIKALVGTSERTSKVQHIFLSYPQQKIFYDWAKKQGVPERQLEYVFQYPRGRRALAGKIRHVKGHTGHMHVRFKCPPKDTSCVM